MEVLVATTKADCVAHRCLHHEGIKHEIELHGDDTSYSSLIVHKWMQGKPFIIIEHDLCPWIGAIHELINCTKPFCGFPTVRWGSRAIGMACVKITPEGDIPENLCGASWQYVDGIVIPALKNLYGPQHLHSPGIAHAREW